MSSFKQLEALLNKTQPSLENSKNCSQKSLVSGDHINGTDYLKDN